MKCTICKGEGGTFHGYTNAGTREEWDRCHHCDGSGLEHEEEQPVDAVSVMRETAERVARRWAEHFAGGDGDRRLMEKVCDDIADEIAALPIDARSHT